MPRIGLLALGILAFSLVACSDGVVDSSDTEFPEKLSAYESFFDLPTLEQRRNDLISRLPANSLVVIATNDIYSRNGSITYEFRPASTFYYLTGFDEPNAAAIIRANTSNPGDSELIMFVEERTDNLVRWIGPSYGMDGAVEHFGADGAYQIGVLASILNEHMDTGQYQTVYSNLGINADALTIFNATRASSLDVFDLDVVVDAQRVVKSPGEIAAIRRAVDVSVQAFSEAMESIKPGMYEYEVDALFDYVLRVNGSPRAAFPTIVASGPNSNVLHYGANQRQMQDGELVMIDFGAEYGYYASDVTRTLPVSGTYSPEQATLYNIVLETQRSAIEAARPGVTYGYLYELARDIALDGLIANGIVTGDKAEIIDSGRFRRYIPAGLGHCVGLDVHDPFPVDPSGEKVLAANMVIAFEPHIYLAEGDLTVAVDFRGVSARIEDTVLITATGAEVLSKALPVEIAEIEARME